MQLIRSRQLDQLTEEALWPGGPAGTGLLTAPEMVPGPVRYRHADGLDLWRRHGAEIYTTRGHARHPGAICLAVIGLLQMDLPTHA